METFSAEGCAQPRWGAPVVIVLDGAARTALTLERGLRWAKRVHAPVHIVAAIAREGSPEARERGALEGRLRGACQEVDPDFAGAITLVDDHGPAARSLPEVVSHVRPHPQLVVIDYENRSWWARWAGPKPTNALLAHSDLSVLAAGPAATRGPVVAVARDSEHLATASFAAAAEAVRRDVPLEVWSPPHASSLSLGAAMTRTDADLPEVVGSDSAERLSTLARKVDVTTLPDVSPQRLEDLLEAREAGLVVVAEREAQSRWDDVTSPRLAPAVARRTECSVLVVRPPGPPPGLPPSAVALTPAAALSSSPLPKGIFA